MALPFFYTADYDGTQQEIGLDEDNSRHVIQVLRMKPGESLHLTDGKGHLLTCSITDNNKKHTTVRVNTSQYSGPTKKKVSIAISLLKNSNRFEWFLEKATEIGVSEIIPLICERTEKEKFRTDRLQGICVSAMLQSQQTWLPVLREPVKYIDYIKFISKEKGVQKFVAHCVEGDSKTSLLTNKPFNCSTILIGPEGDFTANEIKSALENGFMPVSLGDTRLRTETAGVVAASLLLLGD